MHSFPNLLKTWRGQKRISQLELADLCGVSQKHISFLELGRSNPSRTMICSIGDALNMPLAERNRLLTSAGFAPQYHRGSLSDPELRPIKTAVDRLLRANEPYPAIALDRLGNRVASNEPAKKLTAFLLDIKSPDQIPEFAGNSVKSLLHPDGYRHYIRNWDTVASATLRRVRAETANYRNDSDVKELFDEILSYEGIPSDWQHRSQFDDHSPVLVVDFEKGRHRFSIFLTITTLGTPLDILAQEIRIQSFFPANKKTERFFNSDWP